MKSYSIQDFKNKFKALGFIWPEVHLIGVRNSQDNPDQFDDEFYLIKNDQIIGHYSGTTNPGSYYLKNFINPVFAGTAIMASNQQVIDGFVKGMIFGRMGWRQRKPIKIFRDTNKDLKSDEMGIPIIAGPDLCLHIHAMFKAWILHAISKIIWNWSAACQGMNKQDEWEDFMEKTNDLQYLSYTLLKEF